VCSSDLPKTPKPQSLDSIERDRKNIIKVLMKFII